MAKSREELMEMYKQMMAQMKGMLPKLMKMVEGGDESINKCPPTFLSVSKSILKAHEEQVFNNQTSFGLSRNHEISVC